MPKSTASTLVKLNITHGEYEFCSFIVVRSDANIDDIAKYFYSDDGGDKNSKEDGYYFDGGNLYVEVAWAREINSMQLKVLQELGIM